MSKTLIILRHAKSDWSQTKLADIDRPLNPRGLRDARLIGDWLHQYCIDNHIDSMHALISPATRAVATHQVLMTCLHEVEDDLTMIEDLYMSDSDEMLEIIQRCDPDDNVLLLIGHNPGMHELVEQLTSRTLDKFPTCAIACIEFDVTAWDQISPATCTSCLINKPRQLRHA